MEKMPVETQNSDRADIVDWRSRYLLKMKYQDKGHPIFYIDESWVDSNLTCRKCWQNEEVMGVQGNVNSGNRLIMLHVGGINGFLPTKKLTKGGVLCKRQTSSLARSDHSCVRNVLLEMVKGALKLPSQCSTYKAGSATGDYHNQMMLQILRNGQSKN
jgi:hypothetical protein